MTQLFLHIHSPCWSISLSASVPVTVPSCYTTLCETSMCWKIALNVDRICRDVQILCQPGRLWDWHFSPSIMSRIWHETNFTNIQSLRMGLKLTHLFIHFLLVFKWSQHIVHNIGDHHLSVQRLLTLLLFTGNKANTVEDIFLSKGMIERCNNVCRDLFVVVGAIL